MMIRKSGLFLLVIVPVLALVIGYFTRNAVVTSVATLALERMVGGKVLLDGVDLSPGSMSATFQRLRISDTETAGTALLSAGPARFEMNGLQLFARKLIVNEMRVDGLSLGQPCQPCRPLPRPPAPPTADGEGGTWSLGIPLPELNLDALKQELDLGKITEGLKLDSLQGLDKAQSEAQARLDSLSQRRAQLDSAGRLKAIQERVQKLDFSSKDPRVLKASLDGLKESLAQVKALRGEVGSLAKDVQAEPGRTKDDVSTARKSLGPDVAAAMKNARLGSINAQEMGALVFGPVVLERFNWVLDKVKFAREMLGAGDQGAPKPPRRAGRPVAFPVTGRAYPGFLVEQIAFTGSNKDPRGFDVQYTGSLRGVSSNARVYGQPMRLDATAKAPEGENWVITGSFDHRNSPGEDRFEARGTGVHLSDVKLSGGSLPQRAIARNGDVTLTATLRGSKLEAALRVDAKNVRFQFAPGEPTSTMQRQMRELFADLEQVRVEATLAGTLRHPRVRISSSIDEQLSRRMGEIVGKRRAEAEAKVRAQLEERLAAKEAELRKAIEGPQQELIAAVQKREDELRAYQAELERRQEEASAAARQRSDGKAQDLRDRLKKR